MSQMFRAEVQDANMSLETFEMQAAFKVLSWVWETIERDILIEAIQAPDQEAP